MTGQRERVDRRFRESNRNFSNYLDGVGMKQDAMTESDLSDFLDGKKHTGLIVRPHRRNNGGLRGDGALKFVEVNISF